MKESLRNSLKIFVAWIVLFSMLSVFFVKDFHTHNNRTLILHHHTDSIPVENHHSCPICDFYFDPYIQTESVTLENTVILHNVERQIYIDRIIKENNQTLYLRAPPVFV